MRKAMPNKKTVYSIGKRIALIWVFVLFGTSKESFI
jgi:hypothetical protein